MSTLQELCSRDPGSPSYFAWGLQREHLQEHHISRLTLRNTYKLFPPGSFAGTTSFGAKCIVFANPPISPSPRFVPVVVVWGGDEPLSLSGGCIAERWWVRSRRDCSGEARPEPPCHAFSCCFCRRESHCRDSKTSDYWEINLE